MKHRVYIIAILTVLIISAVFILKTYDNAKPYAEVYADDELFATIDLSERKDTYEIPVEKNGHTNIIRVENGKISVIGADCPDKLCVKQGASDNFPIVCLPNKMYIKFSNSDNTEKDAVSR